jgi:hypothetical protein
MLDHLADRGQRGSTFMFVLDWMDGYDYDLAPALLHHHPVTHVRSHCISWRHCRQCYRSFPTRQHKTVASCRCGWTPTLPTHRMLREPASLCWHLPWGAHLTPPPALQAPPPPLLSTRASVCMAIPTPVLVWRQVRLGLQLALECPAARELAPLSPRARVGPRLTPRLRSLRLAACRVCHCCQIRGWIPR